jgi:hypothetical protein
LSADILDDPVAIERLLRRLLRSAKRRAARTGIPFNLEPEDLPEMWRAQEGRCAVSGLRFNMTRFPDALVKHPYGPSLDKVNAFRGYVRGNVRLVCTAVNFGLGQWGDEVFRAIAEATVHRQATILKDSDAQLTERIRAAEAVLHLLSGPEVQRQHRRIAALKRARTLGSEGLSRAARAAWRTRR